MSGRALGSGVVEYAGRPVVTVTESGSGMLAELRRLVPSVTARETAGMSVVVEPASAVLLLVGREQYTPPSSFGGRLCAATHDCIAVGVVNPSDGPTTTQVAPHPVTTDLMTVGEFDLETEGLVSVRDIYGREYQSMGADAGLVHVVVWADDDEEPTTVFFAITPPAG